MSVKNNVIDFSEHLEGREKVRQPKADVMGSSEGSVLDMTQRRNEIIQNERREVRRTILTEFIGAFVVVPQKGLMRVSLYDISKNGLAFDLEADSGVFKNSEEAAMRVYLNHKTYFPFVVKVQNIRWIENESVYRHGAHFLKETVNSKALHHFVRFIETVSASLETDQGDIMVSNLGR